MGELFGWKGQILRIDLTTGKTRLTPTTDYIPRFMGGRGVCDKIYWDEIPPEVKAFDAGNKLIFMTGPATGTLGPQSGRLHIVAKSPAHPTNRQGTIRPYPGAPVPENFYHGSNAGGLIAKEVKRAGYDGIIVEGKSKDPVYAYIKDDKVELRDAKFLFGLTIPNKQRLVYNACDKDVVMLTIGPAAENLNRTAVISSGLTDTFGTGGFGAVMASKNLLAIAVKGTGGVKVAEPKKLVEIFYTWSRTMTRKETEMVPFDGVDTEGNMAHWRGIVYKIRSWNYYHSLNELEGTIVGEDVAKGLAKAKWRSCSDCPVACRFVIHYGNAEDFTGTCKEVQLYYPQERTYYGTKKTIGPATVAHAVLANDLGIATDSAWTGLITVIDAMAKKGILTPQNSGLPVDKIGSNEFITQLWEKIARREGIGNALADDAFEFMRTFSKESEELYKSTYEKKKPPEKTRKANSLLVLSGFEDHGQLWWNLTRASKKALHKMAAGSPEEIEVMKRIGKAWFGTELTMDDTTWETKPLLARMYTYYLFVVDSLPSCVWGSPAWYNLYTDDHIGYLTQMSDTYTAVTGIKTTEADIRKIGERLWNLERAIRVREGRTRKDDWGWMDEAADGAKELKEALEKYYDESGWDKATGWPTRAKLEELDLKDVADGLAKLGKLP